MSIENQTDMDIRYKIALYENRAIVTRAIALAPRSIAQAMTEDTYSALAYFASCPSTYAEYLQSIFELQAANKDILRSDIDSGIGAVKAIYNFDWMPTEFLWPDERDVATINDTEDTKKSEIESGELPQTTRPAPKTITTPYQKGWLSQSLESRAPLIEHAAQLVIEKNGQLPATGIKFGIWHQLLGKVSNGVLCTSIIVTDVNAIHIDLEEGLVTTVDRDGKIDVFFMGSSPE